MRHFCTDCNQTQSGIYSPFCECGGMIDIQYDLSEVRLHDSKNSYHRFSELLPIKTSLKSLPQESVYSPVIEAKKLGAYLGMPNLFLKNETVLPTGSTKDRMAAVSLAYLREQGVRAFCTSSTGNSSTSYAYAIPSYPDMQVYLFTAENFVTRVQFADNPQVHHFGMRDASFVDAFDYAGVYAKGHDLVSERGFFNPGRREGLKLAYLEAAEQISRPIDWYVQAVSSAMGVYGCYKGAKELLGLGAISKLPRLLCVQQSDCAPMVHAYKEGSPSIRPHHIISKPAGIAEAILRGDPSRAYPHVRRIVVESGGDFVAVSEDEIRRARMLVEEMEGVSPCFSASASVAGVIRQVSDGLLPKTDTVLINLTGSDRRREVSGEVSWLKKINGGEWTSEGLLAKD